MAKDLILRPVTELSELTPPGLILSAGRAAGTAYRDFFEGELANANTRRAYNQAISQFASWAESKGLTLETIRAGDVGKYLRSLKLAPSSKKQHRSALKRFFDLLVERHVVLLNPATVAKTEKVRVKQGLTPEIDADEVRTLLETLQGDTLSQIRDRAIIGILVYTACRAGAIAKLTRGDYRGRPGAMQLRFIEKGGNHQGIEVRHDLESWIDAYLREARIKVVSADSPLFRPLVRKEERLTRSPIHPNDICRLVKRKLRHAGLREELSAHSFRVATITNLISQGIPVEDVQELAGHADARTTKLYDRTNRKATRNLVERIAF